MQTLVGIPTTGITYCLLRTASRPGSLLQTTVLCSFLLLSCDKARFLSHLVCFDHQILRESHLSLRKLNPFVDQHLCSCSQLWIAVHVIPQHTQSVPLGGRCWPICFFSFQPIPH